MPKTIKVNQIRNSQAISYKKKGGKFLVSSADVTDEMRLASKLGIAYIGQANLEDKINARMIELGISIDFVEEVQTVGAGNFGDTVTPASLATGSSFSYTDEFKLNTVKTLNSIDKTKITSIVKTMAQTTPSAAPERSPFSGPRESRGGKE